MRALVAALLLLSVPVYARDFWVEDDSLAPVPSEVSWAIAAASSDAVTGMDGQPCRFVGEAVDLQDSGAPRDWIVTTAEACDWAASAAPIWIVRRVAPGYVTVLSFVTYDVTIGTESLNGMRNLATARGTAARTEEQLWKFDGKEYRLSHTHVREND